MYRTLLDGVRYIAFSMRTNSILTPSKVRYFHVTPCIFNEDSLLKDLCKEVHLAFGNS